VEIPTKSRSVIKQERYAELLISNNNNNNNNNVVEISNKKMKPSFNIQLANDMQQQAEKLTAKMSVVSDYYELKKQSLIKEQEDMEFEKKVKYLRLKISTLKGLMEESISNDFTAYQNQRTSLTNCQNQLKELMFDENELLLISPTSTVSCITPIYNTLNLNANQSAWEIEDDN